MSSGRDILLDASLFDKVLVGKLAQAAERAADAARDKARNDRTWQSRTGNTLSSITSDAYSIPGGGVGIFLADSENAVRLNEGTPPHKIYPKAGSGFVGPTRAGQGRRSEGDIGTARATLRFEVGGQVIFRPFVQHPGTAADPYLDRGAEEMERKLEEEVDRAIDEALGV